MIQTNPLSNHNLFISHDLGETQDKVGQFIWPHRMQASRSSHIDARLDGVVLGDMGLYYLQYGANVSIDAGEISDYYLIQTALSGKACVTNGSHQVNATAGFTTLVSPQGITKIQMGPDCSYLVLVLKRQALERQLSKQKNKNLQQPILFDLSPSQSSQTRALQQTLGYFCQQYNDFADQLNQPRVNHQFSELVISLLLNTWRHNYSEQLRQTSPAPLPWHVRKAADYIRENISNTISLQEVALQVGVTPRTLQNGFNHFLNQTPSRYIQSMRLNLVHESLQQANPQNTSVTEILLDKGINDAGRFAQLYKRRFGELPSETLKR